MRRLDSSRFRLRSVKPAISVAARGMHAGFESRQNERGRRRQRGGESKDLHPAPQPHDALALRSVEDRLLTVVRDALTARRVVASDTVQTLDQADGRQI